MVRAVGIEPTLLAEPDFESGASTNSTTPAAAPSLDQATGDRKTLKWDSFIPAIMAAIYLLLFLYFKTIGGYKPVSIMADPTKSPTGPPK